MGLIKEFKEFFDEYKIVGLAVAFVMGAAVSDVVGSLVKNIIMPIIDPLIKEGTWQTAVLKLGPFVIKWGEFSGSLINFLVIALVIFIIVKSFKKRKTAK